MNAWLRCALAAGSVAFGWSAAVVRGGADRLLAPYRVGLTQFDYKNSPPEAIAYDLQTSFERGAPIPAIRPVIERNAFRTRDAAATVLAAHGIGMGA